MESGQVVHDFTADNTTFSFLDDRGRNWAGSSRSYREDGNKILISAIIGIGPTNWIDRWVNLAYDKETQTLDIIQ